MGYNNNYLTHAPMVFSAGYWPTIVRQALPMLGPLVIYTTPPWAQAGLELTTSCLQITIPTYCATEEDDF